MITIIYIITFGFIVLDFLSGIMKALAVKQLASQKMREGLFHKVALGLCMLAGWIADIGQQYMELGFTVPVGSAICVYIVLMELTSITENVCTVNPQLKLTALRKIFAGNVDGGDKHGKDE